MDSVIYEEMSDRIHVHRGPSVGEDMLPNLVGISARP